MYKLLIGISLTSLSSGLASAQSSQLTQTGNGNSATVDNIAAGNNGDVSSIVQNGTSNDASVFQRGLDNSSTIQQFGTTNTAAHRQYAGNRNRAETRQGSRNGGSDDDFSVIRQQGNDNSGLVLQDGFANSSTVNQGVAVVSGAVEARATNNNRVSVDQVGSGLQSTIEQRGANATALAASDNTANARQRGANNFSPLQQSSSIIQESRGNYAEVFQFEGSTAAPNTSSLTQRHSAANSSALISSNMASVAQRGLGNQSALTQDGLRNIAFVTMQQGGPSQSPYEGNRVTLRQVGNDLTARTVSSGMSNVMNIDQIAVSSDATLWQQSGSQNELIVRQGAGASTTPVNGTPAGGTSGPNATNLSATVTQGATLNSATVNQDGTSLEAIVEQFGSGLADPTGNSGSAGTYRNLVTIQQTGSNHYARAFQAPGVGSSGGTVDNPAGPASGVGFTYGFAGGRRSAEITILQSNSGNSATVQQFGSGQLARIEQSGTGGEASIIQNAAATNATAVIQQTGTNNSYSVSQTVAGAYIHVTQTGNGNEATNVVSSPPVP